MEGEKEGKRERRKKKERETGEREKRQRKEKEVKLLEMFFVRCQKSYGELEFDRLLYFLWMKEFFLSRRTDLARLGFIMAAAGSAVGLGNVWGFPTKTASNGGAAFLVIYLIMVFPTFFT